MLTKLVKPPGFEFRPVGSGYVFADGTAMHEQADKCYYLPDSHLHYLDALISKGWKVWAPPVPKRVFADEWEREAVERPMDVGAILKLAREEEAELRAEGGKLRKLVVRGLSPRLAAHLKVQRIAVRSELERRQPCPLERCLMLDFGIKKSGGGDQPVWRITKFRITECSLVDNPANDMAIIESVQLARRDQGVSMSRISPEIQKLLSGRGFHPLTGRMLDRTGQPVDFAKKTYATTGTSTDSESDGDDELALRRAI